MTLAELVYDIKMIMSKARITNDSRFGTQFLAYKIHNYRATMIRFVYTRTRKVDPVWLQDFGQIKFTKVDSSDDPNITIDSSLKFGKLTIPHVVSLPEEMGAYMIGSSSKHIEFYKSELRKLMLMIEMNDFRLKNHTYYFRINDAIYTYPYHEYGSMQLILDNPLDGYTFWTEYIESGSIELGQTYKVYENQVSYNGTVYEVGGTFTGVSGVTTFSGNGKVKYNNQKRVMTYDDQYPISNEMGQEVVINILTKDFSIEERKVSDIINDAQDQLTALSSGIKQ